MSIVGLLIVLFTGLKLTGYIVWPWLWVLAPLWITAIVYIIAVIVSIIVPATWR